MKRMMAFLMLGFFCMSANLRAMSVYNAMSNMVVAVGDVIEKTDNLPLLGKLTNMLPFGVIATSCKEYPGQTLLLSTALLCYILSKNESVVALYNSYKNNVLERLGIKRVYNVTCDDTLFVFDGDDEDDAEDQMDMEDDLLSGDDIDWMKKDQQSPFSHASSNASKIKFL